MSRGRATFRFALHDFLARGVLLASLVGALGCGTRPASGLPSVGPSGEVCQANCTPDRGSGPYDCASAETAGVEFMDEVESRGRPAPTPMLVDAESGMAPSTYSYTDGTAFIQTFKVGPARKTWEPPTDLIPGGPRCGSTRALHVQGGPFFGWGGGIGMAMSQWAGAKAPCMASPPASYCAKSADPILNSNTIDVSQWEGLSFWARRGPNSQVGFRVSVGDASTDDDIAYRAYKADPTKPRGCERVRECGCLDHRQCLALPDDKLSLIPGCSGNHGSEHPPYFCGGVPAVEEALGQVTSPGSDAQCNTCDRSRCNDPYPAYPGDATDAQFKGRSCTQYTSRNGVSGFFCWTAPDPARGVAGDPPPAEPDQRCGDHWNRPVGLTSDWRLYLVPFNSLLQQGFGKRSNKLDLTAVSLIRFTWDGGWVDYWIDDVRVYRHTRAGGGPGAAAID